MKKPLRLFDACVFRAGFDILGGMQNIFFHSPFSAATAQSEQNRALILQFILSEIFHTLKAPNIESIFSSSRPLFPYDWANQIGHWNKIREHAILLSYAFPSLPEAARFFEEAVNKAPKEIHELRLYLRNLYLFLEPLIEFCKDNENLIFFLLKHHKEIDELKAPHTLKSLLLKIFPNGLTSMSKQLAENFQRRGFAPLIAEAQSLIAKL